MTTAVPLPDDAGVRDLLRQLHALGWERCSVPFNEQNAQGVTWSFTNGSRTCRIFNDPSGAGLRTFLYQLTQEPSHAPDLGNQGAANVPVVLPGDEPLQPFPIIEILAAPRSGSTPTPGLGDLAVMRSVWEANSDAMALSDPNGLVLAVNPAYCALYGYAEHELVGQSFAVIFPPAARPAAEEAYRTIFAAPDPPTAYEAQIQRSDGTFREVEARASFVEQDGVRTAMVSTIQDITERKRIEAGLREAEERFRSAFEAAAIGMDLVAPDGSYTQVNQALCHILGYAEDELLLKTFQDLTHPDDLPADLALMERLLRGELASYQLEKRYIRKDGSIIWGHLTVSPVRDHNGALRYMVGQIEDVTPHKEAEAALRESEERFRAQYTNNPVPISSWRWIGDDFVLSDHNAAMVAFSEGATMAAMGYSASEVYAEHPDIRADLARCFTERTTIRRDLKWRMSTTGEDKQLIVTYVYAPPDIVMLHVEDGTEQRLAEVATTEALARLEASNRQLESQNAAKSAFVSTISHEFRTPLTSIEGFSELIVDEAETLPEAQAFALTINQNAVRLSRLVQEVLDLDQMASGEITMVAEPVDLNTVVTTTLAAFGRIVSHELEVRLAPALPEVNGDADRLTQVVTNLVANAIKYAPAGGPILVTTRPHPDGVELTVADQGLGVPAEYRESIFEPYGRIMRSEQIMIAGTGLGLPITRQIVTRHGGRIWVEANAPQGSVFHVVLPAISNRTAPSPSDTARYLDNPPSGCTGAPLA